MSHKRIVRLLIGTAIFAALSLIYVIQGLSARLDTMQAVYSVINPYSPELAGFFAEDSNSDTAPEKAGELNEVQNPEELLAVLDCPPDTVAFDGYVDCDLNGDRILEQVTFFTGSNQADFELGKIPNGWDLAAHTVVEGISYQIWFNVTGSVKSVLPYTLLDGRQALLVVCSGNLEDEVFWLTFEEHGFQLVPQ